MISLHLWSFSLWFLVWPALLAMIWWGEEGVVRTFKASQESLGLSLSFLSAEGVQIWERQGSELVLAVPPTTTTTTTPKPTTTTKKPTTTTKKPPPPPPPPPPPAPPAPTTAKPTEKPSTSKAPPPKTTSQWTYSKKYSWALPVAEFKGGHKFTAADAARYSFYAGDVGSRWVEDVIAGRDPYTSKFDECNQIPLTQDYSQKKRRRLANDDAEEADDDDVDEDEDEEEQQDEEDQLAYGIGLRRSAASARKASDFVDMDLLRRLEKEGFSQADIVGDDVLFSAADAAAVRGGVGCDGHGEGEVAEDGDDDEDEDEDEGQLYYRRLDGTPPAAQAPVPDAPAAAAANIANTAANAANAAAVAPTAANAANAANAAAAAAAAPAAANAAAGGGAVAEATTTPPPTPSQLALETFKLIEDFPLTTGECKDAYGATVFSPGRKTCYLKNVYFDRNAFIAHTLRGQEGTLPTLEDLKLMFAGAQGDGGRVKINRIVHNTMADFKKHLSGKPKVRLREGLTAAWSPLWHFNPGHALFDGLYPIFVSLLQWNVHERPFLNLLLCGKCVEQIVEKQMPGSYAAREEVFGQFGGEGILHSDTAPPYGLFEEVVFGVGTTGQKKDHNGNVTLGACRELDACRHYRTRMYKSHNLEPPEPVSSKPPGEWKGIVIENKRYPAAHLEKVVSVLQTSEDIVSSVKMQYVSWSPGKGHVKQSGRFDEHLAIIRDTAIHISGPGTGMMYQTFLPDGAVHINLGTTEGYCQRNYMEEYMAEGSPYIHAMYYAWRTGDMVPEIVADLTNKAINLLKSNPPLPVPINVNLSPVGLVFKAFMWQRYQGENEKALRQIASLRYFDRGHGPQNGNSNFFDQWTCWSGPNNAYGFREERDLCLVAAIRHSFDVTFPHLGQEGVGWFGTGTTPDADVAETGTAATDASSAPSP
mmetsp:Transcript_26861/g.58398  ORF Transcript_26861/g.58398 Transcript_26861/m.58398 type:complete len:929 (-) Transcript_26861:17-2803(-)